MKTAIRLTANLLKIRTKFVPVHIDNKKCINFSTTKTIQKTHNQSPVFFFFFFVKTCVSFLPTTTWKIQTIKFRVTYTLWTDRHQRQSHPHIDKDIEENIFQWIGRKLTVFTLANLLYITTRRELSAVAGTPSVAYICDYEIA